MHAIRRLLHGLVVAATLLLAAGGAAALSTEELYGADPYWTTEPPAPEEGPGSGAEDLTRCYYALFGSGIGLTRPPSMFGA